jgi:hypothetical protein
VKSVNHVFGRWIKERRLIQIQLHKDFLTQMEDVIALNSSNHVPCASLEIDQRLRRTTIFKRVVPYARTTSLACLSVRSPRKTGCRIWSSRVHSVNLI